MRIIQTIQKQFRRSVGLLTAMSAMILVMPWVSELADKVGLWCVRISGIIFWLLAIAGYMSIAGANKNRKSYLKIYGPRSSKNFRPGLFCFFSNRYAEVIDIMLVIFVLAFVISLFTQLRNTYYIIVLLALLIWAANMHGLFNGKIYRIIKNDYKERGSYE